MPAGSPIAVQLNDLVVDVSLASPAVGDVFARGASRWNNVAGNITATRKFFRQTGTGSVSALPAWDTLVLGDLPAGVGLTASPLSQFAATTSAQLLATLTDPTGSGASVFAVSPALTGVPTAPTAAALTNTTQLATTAFVTGAVATAVTGTLKFQGATDCSGNPNYPAASKGDVYVVSVAGKIGGASGTAVDVGDEYFATADNAGGTQAAVGTSWAILEHNLQGALLSANNLSDVASAATARTNLGLAAIAASGAITDATGTLLVGHGGTGLATLTAHALYVGNGASAPTALAVGATNTVLRGSTGADPAFGALVAADLPTTAVTPGSYTLASITVDAQGRLTAASTGTGAATSVSNSDGTLTISPTTGAVVASLALGHANTWTAVQTVTPTQAANTSADGIVLADTTAATSGNQQYSPRLRLTGQGWKTTATAASQAVDWIVENQPVQGTANPSSNLVFSSQINGGGYTPQFQLTTASVLLSLNPTSANGVGKIDLGSSGGAIVVRVSNDAIFQWFNSTTATVFQVDNSFGNYNATVRSTSMIGWGNSTTLSQNSADTCLGRNAAAVVEVNNKTAGQFGGFISGNYSATTNAVVNGLQTSTRSSGTPAAGLGAGHLFTIDSTTTANQNAGRLTYEWVTATHASRAARGKLTAYDTAEREVIRFAASGSAGQLGFFGTAEVAQQTGDIATALSNYGLVTSPTLKSVNPLFDHYTDAGNSTITGETDLYSDTVTAGKLAANGDKLPFEYGLTLTAGQTPRIRVYFAGTLIFDTGAINVSGSGDLSVYGTIIRVSATVVRFSVSATYTGVSTGAGSNVGELTGLTLSGTNVLKITGQDTALTPANNAVVAKLGNVNYLPAA